MFEVTLLKDLSHARDNPSSLGQTAHPPIWGPEGQYFGHEWSKWRHDTLDERVDRLLEPQRDRAIEILDVGCATGARAAEFARAGHKVMALDLIDRSKEIAARNAALRLQTPGRAAVPITFIRGDLRDFDSPALAKSFDMIHARRVLSFLSIEILDEWFGSVERLLRDEGWLVASFIADEIQQADHMRRRSSRGSTPPLQLCAGMYAHHFSEVHHLLRERGLAIVEGFSDGLVEAGFIAGRQA